MGCSIQESLITVWCIKGQECINNNSWESRKESRLSVEFDKTKNVKNKRVEDKVQRRTDVNKINEWIPSTKALLSLHSLLSIWYRSLWSTYLLSDTSTSPRLVFLASSIEKCENFSRSVSITQCIVRTVGDIVEEARNQILLWFMLAAGDIFREG